MNNSYFRLIMVVFLVVIISACSSETASDTEPKKKEPKKEAVEKAPTEPEEMVAKGAGEHYEKVKDLEGDALDEEIKSITKEFPKKLKSEEAYNRIIAAFAADHQPAFQELEDFDITFEEVEAYEKYQEERGKEKKEGPLNVAILLDASGSMAAKVSGTDKMSAAKEALKKFAEGLPEDANVMLRVYGHKGSNANKDKNVSCESTEVMYPLGAYDKGAFQESLSKFKPTGWTPLAASIAASEKDLQGKEGNNVVYVVSDGIETCDGNPIEAAKKLHESNIKAEVNIIGFDVDNKGQQQLKAVAEAGGGEFQSVSSQKELFDQVESNWSKAMHDTRVNWASAMDITDINWSSSNKSMEMGKVYTGTVIESLVDERSLLSDVVMNLRDQKKLSDEELTKLDESIQERYQTLVDYAKEKHQAKSDSLKAERDRVIDVIQKAADEARTQQ
ncbi:VWA domain-containing protein [Fictibacillus phosphorivorans]|uniref:VWA domain-containing protein n=1 Tax=Fictibacillus phosphorivorans TaxID=1221500 RepID=UPI00203DE2FF|nr:VWA domain-containing protein [Fictibacillus phosphorivorans]MCM3719795.1 VWA domain-containing protein [Fictibacillus phosphorivorans]MCM3777534.1 VWA domain-containing protein [Fictibacillus phosphorivorans]